MLKHTSKWHRVSKVKLGRVKTMCAGACGEGATTR